MKLAKYFVYSFNFNTPLLEHTVSFILIYFLFYTGNKHELEKVGEAYENTQVITRSECSTAEESVLESW